MLITSQNGILAFIISMVFIAPALLAVIDGVPCIKKSLERATPLPNKDNATADQILGSPTSIATGTIIAPISMTAGVGQNSQDIITFVIPRTIKAVFLLTINFFIEDIIILSAPISLKDLAMQFIIDIIMRTSIKCLPETTMDLYIIL